MAFSPRQDLAFLPHPRTPPSPNAPLHGFTAISGPSRPTYQRSRSHNSSKSAPTSPAGSLQVTGLTPLSKISSIELGQPVHAPSRSPVARTRSLHIPIPQRRVSHDAGGTSGIDIAQPRYASLPSTSHMSQPTITSPHQIMSSLPPLLNPAARIRTYPRVTPRSGSTSETETETSGNDSDATYRPHRHTSNVQPGPASASGSGDFDGMRNKAQSQPDLTALRSRLEGWAGGVAKETADPRRTTTLKRRTPPARSIPLGSQPTPGHQSPRSRSSIALSSLRRASPRELPATLSPLTPLLSTSSEGSSPRDHRSHLNVADPAGPYHTGEVTGSEGADADDDDSYEGLTDSPSSGSINFSSKRKGLRQRLPVDRNKGGLGLSFGPETPPPVVKKEDPIPAIIERRLQQSSLLSLRLLAVVPSVWGIAVLFQGFVSGEIGVDVWPWGVDLSRDALERLVAGGAWNEGTPRRVSRGDMLLAMAWVGDHSSSARHLLTHRHCARRTFASALRLD